MQNLLTLKEVALILKVDVTTVRRYIKNGFLKGKQLGIEKRHYRWRVYEEDLRQFINKEKNGKSQIE